MKKIQLVAFMSLLFMAVVAMPVVAELLIHYDFDEATGIVANDASGNAHTGTFTVGGYDPPVIWDSGSKPNLAVSNITSARLTANDNTLTTPDTGDLNGLKSLTLMMWMDGNAYNDYGSPAMAWKHSRPGGDGHAGFTAWWSNGTLYFVVGGESSNPVIVADSNAVGLVSGWHHWAVTYDGTNMDTNDTHFYLDGQPIGSAALHQSTVLANDVDLHVSCRGDVPYAQRHLFDEFRMYGSATDSNGALSQEDIQLAMTSPPTTCAGILESGLGLISDLYPDCHVNLLDVNELTDEWLMSNDLTVVSDDPCISYYGFYGLDVTEYDIQTYQQARVNLLNMGVGPHNPEVYKVMRQVGQAGIGVIAEWSYIFRNYTSGQWAAEIANVKNILDAQDVTKYIILNSVIDEPSIPSSETNPMVAAVKSAFPGIPTHINWGGNFATSGCVAGTTADVVGFDHYVWPNESGQTDVDYFNGLIDPRIADIKSLAPGKPIVLVGQSAGWPGNDYDPTAEQMRMYADKAIADPCIHGLLYWAWENGDFDLFDIDMFKAVGADAGLPLCSKRLLLGQDYEGVYDWGLTKDPWEIGEGMTYYLGSGSSVYFRDYAWQVVFANLSNSVDQRVYNLMDDALTQNNDFSLVFYTRSFSPGNSSDDLGYIGLFQSDSALTHDPFVGVNLGAPGGNLSLMLQVRIGDDVYHSEPLDYVVNDNMYYEVVIDYAVSNRTFSYTVVDPNGAVVLTDSYILSEGVEFTLDAFGVSDVPGISDGRSIDIGIDTAAVNITLPELGTCESFWLYGFGIDSDLNQDCSVNMEDFAVLAGQWLECNDPVDPNCQ